LIYPLGLFNQKQNSYRVAEAQSNYFSVFSAPPWLVILRKKPNYFTVSGSIYSITLMK